MDFTKLPLSIAHKLKNFVTSDQSVTSQFFRPDTFQQALKADPNQTPIVSTVNKSVETIRGLPGVKQVYQTAQKFASPPSQNPGLDLAMNYGPQGIAGTVDKKVIGAFLKGDSKIIQGLKDQLNKKLMDTKIAPTMKELYIDSLGKLEGSKIPAQVVDEVNSRLDKFSGTQPLFEVAPLEKPSALRREWTKPVYDKRNSLGQVQGSSPSNSRGQEAINSLVSRGSGEIKGALSHPELGDIDIVWGDGTHGLSHIKPEIRDNLAEIISKSKVVKGGKTRTFLETPDHRSIIVLDWKGEPKKWVLTSYDKNGPQGRN